jgi:hypothetical protein
MLLAHASLHLEDGLVLVFLQPMGHVGQDIDDPAKAVLNKL